MAMKHVCVLPVLLFSSIAAFSADQKQEYPLWNGEAIEVYAKKVGLPPTKTLDLGNGVTMEFVLIPAGKFIMGTPEPEPVDELYYVTKIWLGKAIGFIGLSVFLVLLVFVIARAIKGKHRPQVSLARLLATAVLAGVTLLGWLHWWFSGRAFVEAQLQYKASLVRWRQAGDYEKPAHEVTIVRPFYMAVHEVTQEQYREVMGANPSRFLGQPNLPVEMVSWAGAQEFCRRIEARGIVVRLPSEAEWEYACRAGTRTAYHSGDDTASLDRVGWRYSSNAKKKNTTHPVGQKEANGFGLHDMHGNVWEWCEDKWHVDYRGAPADGSAWTDGPADAERVLRGGSWIYSPRQCRSAHRDRGSPSDAFNCYGFRLVAPIQSPL